MKFITNNNRELLAVTLAAVSSVQILFDWLVEFAGGQKNKIKRRGLKQHPSPFYSAFSSTLNLNALPFVSNLALCMSSGFLFPA